MRFGEQRLLLANSSDRPIGWNRGMMRAAGKGKSPVPTPGTNSRTASATEKRTTNWVCGPGFTAFRLSKPVFAGLVRGLAFERGNREPTAREIRQSRPKVMGLSGMLITIMRAPVPHICRNLLSSKDLWQTDFSRSDAQIDIDISIAATGCVEKFARDVRKVRSPDPAAKGFRS